MTKKAFTEQPFTFIPIGKPCQFIRCRHQMQLWHRYQHQTPEDPGDNWTSRYLPVHSSRKEISNAFSHTAKETTKP